MKIIGIIPARMASTRYPGKPLAEIHGVPMIGHVYQRCKASSLLDDLYVATCDDEIQQYTESIGGKAIMTMDSHERCTDRTVEAVLKIERMERNRADIVVMIQGDEPMTTPEMIDDAVRPLVDDETIQVVNLMASISDRNEHDDPNEVKVVVDLESNALYFSREPIPSWKKGANNVPMLKQVCIIPFKRDFLLRYAKLPPTPLEVIESVDMMRVLEHGYKVKMVMTSTSTKSVDTAEDLKVVESLMNDDFLMKSYC